MRNTFVNTIVFVKDLKRSKEFYTTVLGQKVETEFDTILFFENHFVLHDGDLLYETIFGVSQQRGDWSARNLLIYFESDDLEQSFAAVERSGADIIHEIRRQPWGQRVFRFFDPDGHVLEIGEAAQLETK